MAVTFSYKTNQPTGGSFRPRVNTYPSKYIIPSNDPSLAHPSRKLPMMFSLRHGLWLGAIHDQPLHLSQSLGVYHVVEQAL